MASTERMTFYDEHPFDWASPDGTSEIQLRCLASACRLDRKPRLKRSGFRCWLWSGKSPRISCQSRASLHRHRPQPGFSRARDEAVWLPRRCRGQPAPSAPRRIADVIISDGVIHHTEDPHAAFAENLRILKPGGRMYLGVYKPSGRYPFALQVSRRGDSERAVLPIFEAACGCFRPSTILSRSLPSVTRQKNVGRSS